MCGRFTLTQSPELIAEIFELEDLPQFVAGYNIAPTQPVPVIRLDHAQRQFDYLYWGLIPSWTKDPTIGSRLINARSETVTEKPSFRAAFKRRRCLIVADGFYEWQKLEPESGTKKTSAKKQPYYFHLTDHQPFGFAGLWEHWQSPAGDQIESCTILTTNANELMQPIHDRMPVILPAAAYQDWLDSTVQTTEIIPLLQPYPEEQMHCYPVSLQVNNPRHDDPDCIAPLHQ
jgi:putative SOS response-associated peptidase YedK